MSRSSSVVTAEQAAQLSDGEFRYELMDGHVHRMSPVGGVHDRLVLRLGAAMQVWLEARPSASS